MQDLFLFEQHGTTSDGKVKGRFFATGIVPKFAEKLKAAGMPLSLDLLDHSLEV
jgi:pilus assembly protein CpaF